jgi:glutathione-regulated potassium-efflux system protein KefB
MRFEAQILGGLQSGRDFTLKNAGEQAREVGRTGAPSEPIIPADGQPEKV